METTTPKPFVFVLMPFDSAFDDIYQLGIKAACNDAGGYCERVDEQMFHDSILERVYNQIAKADLLVADMTGRNPNVFYEVGYAHALGRRVILLTQRSEDIPFDLKHYPHIVYGGKITELKQELEKRVRWAFANPLGGRTDSDMHVELSIYNRNLLGSPTIEYITERGNFHFVGFDVSVHNSTKKTIEPAEFQIGFLAESRIHSCRAYEHSRSDDRFPTKGFPQPDGKVLFVMDRIFQILPGSWEKFFVCFDLPVNAGFKEGEKSEFVLRLFSVNGTQDYPFNLEFKPKATSPAITHVNRPASAQ